MSENKIVILICAGLIILDVIWFLIRGKKDGFVPKEQRSKKMLLTVVLGYVCALGLLAVCWFRTFTLTYSIILGGCCVLAVELENRILLGKLSMYDEAESGNNDGSSKD